MLVAIGPINGPLLQKASHIAFGNFSQDVNIEIMLAQSLPDGYTGYLSGRKGTPALLTSNSTQVVNSFNIQRDITVSTTGCTGECTTIVRGAGFAINCSTSTVPYSLTPTSSPDGSVENGQEAMVNGTQAFGSSMSWEFGAPGTIEMRVQFKNTDACDGNLQMRNCTMQAAVVEYPVIIDGNKSTILLAFGSTMSGDTVHQLSTVFM